MYITSRTCGNFMEGKNLEEQLKYERVICNFLFKSDVVSYPGQPFFSWWLLPLSRRSAPPNAL